MFFSQAARAVDDPRHEPALLLTVSSFFGQHLASCEIFSPNRAPPDSGVMTLKARRRSRLWPQGHRVSRDRVQGAPMLALAGVTLILASGNPERNCLNIRRASAARSGVSNSVQRRISATMSFRRALRPLRRARREQDRNTRRPALTLGFPEAGKERDEAGATCCQAFCRVREFVYITDGDSGLEHRVAMSDPLRRKTGINAGRRKRRASKAARDASPGGKDAGPSKTSQFSRSVGGGAGERERQTSCACH